MLINTVFFECDKSVQDVYFHEYGIVMEKIFFLKKQERHVILGM